MSTPTYMHHSGWPWPLDGVQDWFEDLWDLISGVAERAARLVWDLIPGVVSRFFNMMDALTDAIVEDILQFFEDPVGALKKAFDWVISGLTDLIGWWDPEQGRFVGGFLGWLWDTLAFIGEQVSMAGEWVYESLTGVLARISSSVTEFVDLLHNSITGALSWLSDVLWGWVDGALKWASDTFKWLRGEINLGLKWVVDSVGTAFDGAMTIVGEAIGSVFGPFIEGFLWIIDSLKFAFGKSILPEIVPAVFSIGGALIFVLKEYLGTPTVGKPEGAEEFGITWREHVDDQMTKWYNLSLWAEAASFGQLDVSLGNLFMVPKVEAFRKSGVQVYMEEIEASLLIPWRQTVMAKYTPELPPVLDLIRFVVREVITPERFSEIMPYWGFSTEWADAYWNAHWILPAPASLYDAFHRGIIGREELDKYLVWHDFSPEPRPGISKTDVEIMRGIIKRLIPRVDLRYAWEMGRLTDTELVERYELLGYEEDSALMADIQKLRALVEEIHKVRDEWIRYFLEGFILEPTLRANLEAIGIGPDRVDYYVAYAVKRREREAFKEWLDIYEDAYSKDLLTDEELETQASEIIIEPRALKLFLQKAYIRKYKKPKAD